MDKATNLDGRCLGAQEKLRRGKERERKIDILERGTTSLHWMKRGFPPLTAQFKIPSVHLHRPAGNTIDFAPLAAANDLPVLERA